MPVQKKAKVFGGAINGTIQRRGKLFPFNDDVFILDVLLTVHLSITLGMTNMTHYRFIL
jgi:hypothetical protein